MSNAMWYVGRFVVNTLMCALAFVGIAFWVYVALSAWLAGIYGLFTISLIVLGLFALIAVLSATADLSVDPGTSE